MALRIKGRAKGLTGKQVKALVASLLASAEFNYCKPDSEYAAHAEGCGDGFSSAASELARACGLELVR